MDKTKKGRLMSEEGLVASGHGGGFKDKAKREIKSMFWIVLIVFAFRSSFFEPNHIPSGSMLPTLVIGDFIVVNKMAYGFKVPYSDLFSDPVYPFGFKPPKRGDIVVFNYPRDPSTLFVKRVIGVPGDKIEVLNNNFYLNGKRVEGVSEDPEKFKHLLDRKFSPENLTFERVKHGDNEFIRTLNNTRDFHLNTMEPITVPEGRLFVMGDNRDHSSDSRVWGFVPFDHVRGKAMFVWFNMVYPWSKEVFHFRPERIGTVF